MKGSGYMTPAERSAKARRAGLANLTKNGPHALSAPARAAFLRRFDSYSDPATARAIYMSMLARRRWQLQRDRAAAVEAEAGPQDG